MRTSDRKVPSRAEQAVSAVFNNDSDIDALADAVIAGRYDVGGACRAALGDKYDAVQGRVSEKLKEH